LQAQVVVSTGELQSRVNKWIRLESRESHRERGGEEVRSEHPRPDLPNEYVSPGNATEEAIVGIWQELLGIGKIGIHDNFFDLGGHSLLVASLTAHLKSAFPEVEFPAGCVFESPTIQLLSERVVGERKPESSFVQSKSRGKRRKERRLRRTMT
jgi:hypothetical protein